MPYTVQGAKDAIQALIDEQVATGKKVITEESLRNIIKDLDLNAGNGKTTVLYSGMSIDDALKNNPNIRILDNTEASKFLEMAKNGNNQVFTDALTMLYNEEPNLQKSGAGTKANIFVNGITTEPRTTGLWDMISDTFVRNAPADSHLITLIGEGADTNAVFMGTEWKAVQESGKYTHINGEDSAKFITGVNDVLHDTDKSKALHVFQEYTLQRKYAASAMGLNIGSISTDQINIFNSNANNQYGAQIKELDEAKKALQQLNNIPDSVMLKIAKRINDIGPIGAAIGALFVLGASAQAAESGDTEGAKQILIEYGADQAGSAAGEVVGAVVGGIAVAVIGGLSAPVAGIIIIGATLAGGFLGGDFAVDFYNDNLKDIDNNGRVDMFDKLHNVFFGVGDLQEQLPLLTSGGTRVNLSDNITKAQLIANAIASPAWMYALKHLNPFVIANRIDFQPKSATLAA